MEADRVRLNTCATLLNLSQSTRTQYQRTLRDFTAFTKKGFLETSLEDIANWKYSLKVSDWSWLVYVDRLRASFDHICMMDNVHRYNPFIVVSKRNHKSIPVHRRRPISLGEVRLLMKQCENIEDRFLLAIFFSTGLRINQVASITREQLVDAIKERIIDFRYAKRKQQRFAFISREVLPIIEEYLSGEHRLSYWHIERRFKYLAKKAGLNISPHTARHTLIHLLRWDGNKRKNVDLSDVSRIVGHKVSGMTELYDDEPSLEYLLSIYDANMPTLFSS
jgi:integrase